MKVGPSRWPRPWPAELPWWGSTHRACATWYATAGTVRSYPRVTWTSWRGRWPGSRRTPIGPEPSAWRRGGEPGPGPPGPTRAGGSPRSSSRSCSGHRPGVPPELRLRFVHPDPQRLASRQANRLGQEAVRPPGQHLHGHGLRVRRTNRFEILPVHLRSGLAHRLIQEVEVAHHAAGVEPVPPHHYLDPVGVGMQLTLRSLHGLAVERGELCGSADLERHP